MEQVASLLGLCYTLNVRPKLPTRSTGTQSSHQKSNAGKPERGQQRTAGRLSALGRRSLDRERGLQRVVQYERKVLTKRKLCYIQQELDKKL